MGREVNLGFLALWESVWGSAKPVSILKPAATFGGCGALEFVYVYGALCAHKAYEPVMKRSFLRLGTLSWRGLLGEAHEAWERGPPGGVSPAALSAPPAGRTSFLCVMSIKKQEITPCAESGRNSGRPKGHDQAAGVYWEEEKVLAAACTGTVGTVLPPRRLGTMTCVYGEGRRPPPWHYLIREPGYCWMRVSAQKMA